MVLGVSEQGDALHFLLSAQQGSAEDWGVGVKAPVPAYDLEVTKYSVS